MKTHENKTNYFERVRESLRHWPYTIHQIDDTLDVGLIEGRGKQLLFRAIHSENLMAFAGSGLSMSYGRLSWKDWEREQKRTVKNNAKLFDELANAAERWITALRYVVSPRKEFKKSESLAGLEDIWKTLHEADPQSPQEEMLPQPDRHNIWQWLRGRDRAIRYAKHQCRRLHQTFILTQDEGGHFPGGEEMPVKFEIAQQLHNELQRYARIFMPETPLSGREKKEQLWPGAHCAPRSEAPFEALSRFCDFLYKNRSSLGPARGKFVERRKEFTRARDNFEQSIQQVDARLGFEQLAKALLLDECPHAMMLLRNGLLKGLDKDSDGKEHRDNVKRINTLERNLGVFDDKNQRRDIRGIREMPERYRVLTPFLFDQFKALREALPLSTLDPHWQIFWNEVDSELEAYRERVAQSGDPRKYLTPTSRFLVSVALAQSENPFKTFELTEENAANPSPFLAMPDAKNFTSRRSIIANRFDPLPKIHQKLGVKRFITTNYDFEIERYFQDIGYRNLTSPIANVIGKEEKDQAAEPLSFRTDNIGRTLTDQTFVSERAAELISFSLADRNSGAGVFHLHGRATREDSLVITERDYMRLYLTEDDKRETTDEGIRIAFSGAPLLFVGLGMEETDLLRPLRQFISNRDRTIGYTSIALLPAEKPIAARTKFSSSLYLRYGVHTIFYGSGQIKWKGRYRSFDWLHRIIALIEGLKAELEIWEVDEQPTKRSGAAILKELIRKVGKIGPDLVDPSREDYHEDIDALPVLLDLANGKSAKVILKALEPDENACCIRVCNFTPTRQTGQDDGPHLDEANTTIDGDKYVGFYTRLLDRIFKIVLHLPEARKNSREGKVQIAPIRIALDGLQSAFITGSLNAALEGIIAEQNTWWRNWQQSPPLRLADAERHNKEGAAESMMEPGTVFIRHKVDNVFTALNEAQDKSVSGELMEDSPGEPARLSAANRTHVRTFDTFVAALASTFVHRNDSEKCSYDANRRQIFTVAARRGMGKGTFLSAFSSKLGQSAYHAAVWPGEAGENVFYAASIFINFGLSTEIASGYDMIANAMISTIAMLEAKQHGTKKVIANDQKKIRQELRSDIKNLSRLASIKFLFRRFTLSACNYRDKQESGQPQPRLLLSLSAVDLLFDHQGNCKNSEIENLLDLFISSILRECPVDLVFICDDTRLGWPWTEVRKKKSGFKHLLLDRKNLPLHADEQIERSISSSRIRIDETIKKRTKRLAKKPGELVLGKHKEVHFIHYTRPVNSIWLLIDNFPVLATGLYLLNGLKGLDEANIEKMSAIFDTTVHDGREKSDKKVSKTWQSKDLVDAVKLDKDRRIVHSMVEEKMLPWLNLNERRLDENITNDLTFSSIMRGRLLRDDGQKDAHEWRDTRRGLGNSRFALTILLSAAEHIIIHTAKDAPCSDETLKGTSTAERLILDTVNKVRNIGHEKRDQLVLETVLDVYRRMHVIADPDLDCELHTLLLRHLGVIGSPIDSAVLVRLTEVREYFKRIGLEPETSRRRFIVRALTTLAHRGLVFRITPHPRKKALPKGMYSEDWEPKYEYRYALHRVVQRYALRNLEAGPAEPARTNTFAPTIYPSMPSRGPKLSRASYSFMRSLMIGLSQYPDVPNSDTSAEPWLFTTQDRNVRAEAVRAALTMARSTFSVAVISRLAEHKPIGVGIQKRGYLETYRIRLRWIIRMAWELHRKKEGEVFEDPDSKYFNPMIKVLYRDEIVWLYNELGVIALAQGTLSDALGYLRQAAEENERIEGHARRGPIYDHLNLNHAIIQLERGSFVSARERLDSVIQSTKKTRGRVHHAALGYRCVLEHLSGHQLGIPETYKKVAAFFENRNEDRAGALFSMHHARFIARSDANEADRLIERARDLAESAGHEDIRHQIELSAIRLKARKRGTPELSSEDSKALDQIEDFGQRMGMWNLQVDALWCRAALLLYQGEAATAGKLLIRAMAISKRHALNLRLNNSMTSYAETLFQRGDFLGSHHIAQRSLDLAKQIGYSLETARAQKVLAQSKNQIR